MNPSEEPAFPHTEWTRGGETILSTSSGMTLRDYFAAKALQGMLVDLPKTLYGPDLVKSTTRSAYAIADAMLAAREQP